LVDRGVLRAHGQATLILNASVDIALERVDTGALTDWKAVMRQCHSRGSIMSCLDNAVKYLPKFLMIEDMFASAGVTIRERTVCYMVLCFIQAHQQTQVNLRELLEDSEDGTGIATVIRESQAEIEEAEGVLEGMDDDVLQEVKVEQIINVVLESERNFVEKLVAEGALQEKQAHHLMETVQVDQKASHRYRRASRRTSGVIRREHFPGDLNGSMLFSPSGTGSSGGRAGSFPVARGSTCSTNSKGEGTGRPSRGRVSFRDEIAVSTIPSGHSEGTAQPTNEALAVELQTKPKVDNFIEEAKRAVSFKEVPSITEFTTS